MGMPFQEGKAFAFISSDTFWFFLNTFWRSYLFKLWQKHFRRLLNLIHVADIVDRDKSADQVLQDGHYGQSTTYIYCFRLKLL